MYDVDGNGVIDQEEMTKIVQAIYDMLGAGATKPTDSAEERAKNIFSRYYIYIIFTSQILDQSKAVYCISEWTKMVTAIWQKKNFSVVAFKMTNCRKCWHPT